MIVKNQTKEQSRGNMMGGMSRDLDGADNIVQSLVLLSAPPQYYYLNIHRFVSAQWNKSVRMER